MVRRVMAPYGRFCTTFFTRHVSIIPSPFKLVQQLGQSLFKSFHGGVASRGLRQFGRRDWKWRQAWP